MASIKTTKHPKPVNVVAIKDGWILQKIAEHLSRLDYVIFTEHPVKGSKIIYYINYVQVPDEKIGQIEGALFTHIEERVPKLTDKWKSTSSNLDFAVCMSRIYQRKFRIKDAPATTIPPGVDFNKFILKPLRIGVFGTTKHTGRKGEELLRSVMNMPHIEWVFIGKGWPGKSRFVPDDELPSIYQSLDYLLVSANYEGGPMPAIEALASGVKVIAPPIGWMPELPHIEYKTGSPDSLKKVLNNLVDENIALRESVIDRSWDSFVARHDNLFRGLINALPKPSKRAIRKIIKKV